MLYNCVLVVSDSELDGETMKLCCRRLPRWENGPENPRDWIRLTGPGLPGGWVNVEKLTIINYKYDIRILLIDTTILIYICHIYSKIVCSSSLTASSTVETTKSCRQRLPRWENGPESPRDWIRLTGPGLPGGWVNVEKLTIINYKYDIRILLIDTIILIYICHIYLKIVCSSSLTASLTVETTKSCRRRLPRWENGPENPGDVNVEKLTIINYKYDIRILLINTIILIYICHIYLKIVVLVVSDSELDSGDDKVASSEVSEAGEQAGKLRGDM